MKNNIISFWLVVAGLLLTFVGGWLDITPQHHGCGCGVRFLGLSKHHYWNDHRNNALRYYDDTELNRTSAV